MYTRVYRGVAVIVRRWASVIQEVKIKKSSALIGVIVLLVAAIGASKTFAQQANNGNGQAQALGNHHQELTLTVIPGEMIYLPIPKQNSPVNVQITIPQYVTLTEYYPISADGPFDPGTFGPFVVSFTVADLGERVVASVPISTIPIWQGNGTVICNDSANFGANRLFPLGVSYNGDTMECSNVLDKFLAGVAQPMAGTPNRIMMGVPLPGFLVQNSTLPHYGSFQVYVSMWY